jgi:hypothetical protein
MSRVLFSWTVVRHPVDLYESIYKWLMKAGRRNRIWCQNGFKKRRHLWHPLKSVARLWSPDFSEWVEAVLDQEPMYATRLYEDFCGPEGGEYCQYIGRTESLVEDFIDVMRRSGYGKEVGNEEEKIRLLRPSNRSVNWVSPWTDDLRGRVEKIERLAIKRFYGPNQSRRVYAGLAWEEIGWKEIRRQEKMNE